MLISVILVSYNTAKMSVEAINALFKSEKGIELEVFVIDNASKDHSASLIKQTFPNLEVIENASNVGFGRANNQVLDRITGEYVLLLNTDAFVEPDTLEKTVAYMQNHPKCGILGVRLLGRDGSQQPSCRNFPTPFMLFAKSLGLNRVFPNIQQIDDEDWNPELTRNCDWVPGCYYLIRRQVIQDVGLFDPLYFLYYEEVDHCYATKKAGWDVTYFADASVVHIGGESAKSEGRITDIGRQVPVLLFESEMLYFRKNHGLLGLLWYLILMNLVDLTQLMKDIVRLRGFAKIQYQIKQIFTRWRLLLATNFATKATR